MRTPKDTLLCFTHGNSFFLVPSREQAYLFTIQRVDARQAGRARVVTARFPVAIISRVQEARQFHCHNRVIKKDKASEAGKTVIGTLKHCRYSHRLLVPWVDLVTITSRHVSDAKQSCDHRPIASAVYATQSYRYPFASQSSLTCSCMVQHFLVSAQTR